MADQPDSANKSTQKRIVKNPETFRERAIKAADGDARPSKRGRVRAASGKVVKPVTKPFGAAGRKVSGSKAGKPFRILGKILLPTYLRKSWYELKMVKWPSRKQSFRLTFAVLVFAVVFGITIAIVDYALDRLFKDVLLK